MNALVDFSLLAYLHDATCNYIHWDYGKSADRQIEVHVSVTGGTPYEPWRGRDLKLVFSNVVLCMYFGAGYVADPETLDRIGVGVHPELEEKCASLRSKGALIPPLRLSVAFTSGSALALVCSGVSVTSPM